MSASSFAMVIGPTLFVLGVFYWTLLIYHWVTLSRRRSGARRDALDIGWLVAGLVVCYSVPFLRAWVLLPMLFVALAPVVVMAEVVGLPSLPRLIVYVVGFFVK